MTQIEQLKTLIRKIVKEEVKKSVYEVIDELIGDNQTQQYRNKLTELVSPNPYYAPQPVYQQPPVPNPNSQVSAFRENMSKKMQESFMPQQPMYQPPAPSLYQQPVKPVEQPSNLNNNPMLSSILNKVVNNMTPEDMYNLKSNVG